MIVRVKRSWVILFGDRSNKMTQRAAALPSVGALKIDWIIRSDRPIERDKRRIRCRFALNQAAFDRIGSLLLAL